MPATSLHILDYYERPRKKVTHSSRKTSIANPCFNRQVRLLPVQPRESDRGTNVTGKGMAGGHTRQEGNPTQGAPDLLEELNRKILRTL